MKLDQLIQIISAGTIVVIIAMVMLIQNQNESYSYQEFQQADATPCEEFRGKSRVSGRGKFIDCIAHFNSIKLEVNRKVTIFQSVGRNNNDVWVLEQEVLGMQCGSRSKIWHIDVKTVVATEQRDKVILC